MNVGSSCITIIMSADVSGTKSKILCRAGHWRSKLMFAFHWQGMIAYWFSAALGIYGTWWTIVEL